MLLLEVAGPGIASVILLSLLIALDKQTDRGLGFTITRMKACYPSIYIPSKVKVYPLSQ